MSKPEALRLAELLETAWQPTAIKAAAELRRLHAENEAYRIAAHQWLDKTEWIQKTVRGSELGMHRADAVRQRLSAVEAQRDALLEALKDMLNAENDYPYSGMSQSEIAAINKARAAIKAVEGEKT